MQVGVGPPEDVVTPGCGGQLVVVVGGGLGRLVEGVEGLAVRVGEVVHGGGRPGGRGLVLVVVGRWEGRREVGWLEVRVLVRTGHGVGRGGVGGSVAVVVVMVVRGTEGRRPSTSARPDGGDRPMARQPILEQNKMVRNNEIEAGGRNT